MKSRKTLTTEKLVGVAQPRLVLPSSFVRMFKPMFAHAVEHGKKLQTVRPTPKRMPKPGDKISLRTWTDKPYRSKQRVLRDAIITGVNEILITECSVEVTKISDAGVRVVDRDPEAFAKLDGFVSWREMREWFRITHGIPFRGVLISWQNDPALATRGLEKPPENHAGDGQPSGLPAAHGSASEKSPITPTN